MLSAPSPGDRVRALAAVVVLALAVIAGLAWHAPPAPVGFDAPPGEFSSGRARVHLQAIAQRPHRIGSADHARVRDYLMEQLRGLGLAPEIQEAVSVQTKYRPARFATVENVMARRHGSHVGAGGQALLLAAHYDSRGMTPGASDDGFGVAALLETARALEAGGPLVSDVIFLFTDGEEEGLLGAHAFVGSHPWAADVGLVLNFDSRGDSGPVLMYQTGDDNGALVRELARVTRPRASSVSQAIYKRMPNDTDLSEWLPRTASLNFANIGGFERYHAPTDTLANLDAGTLQHDGAYALTLTRAFAGRALPLPREPDRVFFNVGPLLVHYPGAYDAPLAILAALLVVAFVAVGHRRGALRAPFALLGLLAALVLVAAAAVTSGVLWAVAARLHPDYRLVNAASPALKSFYLASFVASAVAVVLAAQGWLLRRVRAAELLAGSAIVLAVLALLAASALPGAACLFAWPILAAAPFVAGLLFGGPFDRDTLGAASLAIAAGVPPLVLLVPLVPQLFTAFGPDAAPGR